MSIVCSNTSRSLRHFQLKSGSIQDFYLATTDGCCLLSASISLYLIRTFLNPQLIISNKAVWITLNVPFNLTSAKYSKLAQFYPE